jgi:glutamate synthase domain-containing protein 2
MSPSYDNFLVVFEETSLDNTYDFVFIKGDRAAIMNQACYTSECPHPITTMIPADQVRKVVMYIEKETDFLRNI